MAMLEKWEKEGVSFLLGGDKDKVIKSANNPKEVLNLETPLTVPNKEQRGGNQYDSFFEQ